ncbi:hypothetical protein Afil01_59460 [Actinorhabdospora filicis]|uniref:Uncharacterized protein n=1 Tax=Actinorhabdospora filicis TaxID=1785913 RepID=A0A9W6WBZ7_9ACTN|nr:hypothetical protein [Actinorhabdospora filicis]GLZ81139.1 hypothetical protein Afil01_59460 [Actinorhabdospora filicis]
MRNPTAYPAQHHYHRRSITTGTHGGTTRTIGATAVRTASATRTAPNKEIRMNAQRTTLIPALSVATAVTPTALTTAQMEIQMRSTNGTTRSSVLAVAVAKSRHKHDPRARDLAVRGRQYDFRKGGYRR